VTGNNRRTKCLSSGVLILMIFLRVSQFYRQTQLAFGSTLLNKLVKYKTKFFLIAFLIVGCSKNKRRSRRFPHLQCQVCVCVCNEFVY